MRCLPSSPTAPTSKRVGAGGPIPLLRPCKVRPATALSQGRTPSASAAPADLLAPSLRRRRRAPFSGFGPSGTPSRSSGGTAEDSCAGPGTRGPGLHCARQLTPGLQTPSETGVGALRVVRLRRAAPRAGLGGGGHRGASAETVLIAFSGLDNQNTDTLLVVTLIQWTTRLSPLLPVRLSGSRQRRIGSFAGAVAGAGQTPGEVLDFLGGSKTPTPPSALTSAPARTGRPTPPATGQVGVPRGTEEEAGGSGLRGAGEESLRGTVTLVGRPRRHRSASASGPAPPPRKPTAPHTPRDGTGPTRRPRRGWAKGRSGVAETPTGNWRWGGHAAFTQRGRSTNPQKVWTGSQCGDPSITHPRAA